MKCLSGLNLYNINIQRDLTNSVNITKIKDMTVKVAGNSSTSLPTRSMIKNSKNNCFSQTFHVTTQQRVVNEMTKKMTGIGIDVTTKTLNCTIVLEGMHYHLLH